MSDYVIKTFYFFYEKNIYENKKKTSFVQEDGRNQLLIFRLVAS